MKSSINLSQIKEKEILPGFHGKFVHAASMTMAYWRIEAGHALPEHQHVHEQVVNVLSGTLEIILDGESVMLNKGSVLVIPPNVSHSGLSITDCEILDVFHPIREDLKGENP